MNKLHSTMCRALKYSLFVKNTFQNTRNASQAEMSKKNVPECHWSTPSENIRTDVF